MLDGIAEELVLWQRAEVRVRDTTMAARGPEPHVSTAMSGGPLFFAIPSRRQRSVVIRAATAGLQANRVLRWRATIGDCCANATGLKMGATEMAWRLLTASCGSLFLLA
jgi:hypothetical protein